MGYLLGFGNVAKAILRGVLRQTVFYGNVDAKKICIVFSNSIRLDVWIVLTEFGLDFGEFRVDRIFENSQKSARSSPLRGYPLWVASPI